MSRPLSATVAAVVLLAPLVAVAQSQTPLVPPAPPGGVTMTGCVSPKPDASGRYTFEGPDGLAKYRLTGRRLAQWAGQRVELVGAPPGSSGLAVRGGLVGPQAGARGVALDPAQESVLRQPGGGASGTGPTYPEFKVARVKAVPGTCEESP
jgi:hypothetical protein